MAPEQITEGRTSPATDIFAVGVVLYQLLSSISPFDGDNLPNLLFQIVTEDPRPIRELVPDVPRELDRIVAKSMAKEPATRYTNALDMANDLDAVRSSLRASSSADRALTSAAAVGTSAESHGRPTQARTLAYLGAGIVAAVAMTALVWSRFPQAARPASVAVEEPASKPLPSPPAAAPRQTVAKQREPPAVTRRQNPEAGSAASVRDSRARQQLSATPAPLTPQTVVAPQQRDMTSPPPPAPTGADITPAVEAYARAIESRNVGDIRSVEPGLTPEQQRSFEQFFQAAHDIKVTLRVADIASSERAASARLIGRYDYLNSDGGKERQPVSIAATFRHDGKVWRLVSVR